MVNQGQAPLASLKLDWQLTTEQVFSHFADMPWAVLLDSANANHIDAHYDIISFDPIATIVSHNQQVTITENPFTDVKISHSNDDPFTVINRCLQQYFPTAKQTDLPFSGGALGAFSYDLGRSIEQWQHTAKQDIDLPELNLGLYTWALIFDYKEQQWLLVDYQGEQALEARLAILNYLLMQAPWGNEPFKLTSDWQHQMSQAEYQQKFDQIQQYLLAGDCYQINLTQRFSAGYQGDEWQAYLKLRASNQAPFSAFIRLDDAAILSISPERFISLNGDQIETKPIKGTLPRSQESEQDLLLAQQLQQSEKDRAENVMIVDLLRNDIGKVAQAGSVAVPKLFEIESFPAVHHLVSTITAKLAPQYQAADLLRAAFPGGSITGAPKIRAMQIIEELEPSRRSIYCGAIGYISQDGKMDTNITIRTLIAIDDTLYCWAGGGIVADSNCAAEYQETYDKVSKILPILAAEE
ncbi:aminodeoxychorismate synthase component I [Shewanella marina]|uniref:aminodeoxychorismate synthase component I n=1 Tax=Shewanella marina TaxID=487319 RepID=UPI0004700597|nr:aminodeoxychorismate synthase component I [Shewanella marina]